MNDMDIADLIAKVDEMKAEKIRLENQLETKKMEVGELLKSYRQKISQVRSKLKNIQLEDSLNPLPTPTMKPVMPRAINQIDADYRIKLTKTTTILQHTQEDYAQLKEYLQNDLNAVLKKAKKKKANLDSLIDKTQAIKAQNRDLKSDIARMQEELDNIRSDTQKKQEAIVDFQEKRTKLAKQAEQIVQKHYRGRSRVLKQTYKN